MLLTVLWIHFCNSLKLIMLMTCFLMILLTPFVESLNNGLTLTPPSKFCSLAFDMHVATCTVAKHVKDVATYM